MKNTVFEQKFLFNEYNETKPKANLSSEKKVSAADKLNKLVVNKLKKKMKLTKTKKGLLNHQIILYIHIKNILKLFIQVGY